MLAILFYLLVFGFIGVLCVIGIAWAGITVAKVVALIAQLFRGE